MPRCAIHRVDDNEDLSIWIGSQLPAGNFTNIVIKPNWVKEASDPEFPITAMVTSPRVIDATIRACLSRYPLAETITVGDVPLQSCDFEVLRYQAGIDELERRYANRTQPRIQLLDLRREAFSSVDGFFKPMVVAGDPAGYREVTVGADSFLDDVSLAALRVSDYGAQTMRSSHYVGRHNYLISGSVLDADLLINLPKMKTHQKAGITGALKNLVGINGQKGCLAHFRTGDRSDQFMPGTPFAVRMQIAVRGLAQKRSALAFRILRQGWRIIRRATRVEVRGTRENLQKRYYIGDGAWFGNDTIWRMVYDLNRIIRFAPRSGGALASSPQRMCISIMDAVIAGEGDGPLQPLPVPLGVLIASDDPFLLDISAATLMGLDFRRIPTLANHSRFSGGWGQFDPADAQVEFDGAIHHGVDRLPVLHKFLVPPGWKGHIERRAA